MDASLETVVDERQRGLFATPAVNLFSKRLGRVALTPGEWEHHLVADRTRAPMDFEVHSVGRWWAMGRTAPVEFRPLYSSDHGADPASQARATPCGASRACPSERQTPKGFRVPSYRRPKPSSRWSTPAVAPFATTSGSWRSRLVNTNRDLPVLLRRRSRRHRPLVLEARARCSPSPFCGTDAPSPARRRCAVRVGWDLSGW